MVEEELDFVEEPNTQEDETGKSRNSKVVAGLGVLALIIGAAGVILALLARGDLNDLRQEVNSSPDPLPGLQVEMDALQDQLVELEGNLAKSNSQLATVVGQTQRAFDDIMREVKANRDEINKNARIMGEIGQRIVSLEKGKSAPISTQSVTPPQTPSEKPEGGYHTIESGDSFDKLAKLYGATIEAFMNSNPGVDPLRLQIGQQIKIPE